mmetsp:Transcript_5497/g.9528  ORF Transcript_5497/g.9528 Transcript_5497/m.9528 type:complete len:320 (-) Transcript_5497:1343-2302(-)
MGTSQSSTSDVQVASSRARAAGTLSLPVPASGSDNSDEYSYLNNPPYMVRGTPISSPALSAPYRAMPVGIPPRSSEESAATAAAPRQNVAPSTSVGESSARGNQQRHVVGIPTGRTYHVTPSTPYRHPGQYPPVAALRPSMPVRNDFLAQLFASGYFSNLDYQSVADLEQLLGYANRGANATTIEATTLELEYHRPQSSPAAAPAPPPPSKTHPDKPSHDPALEASDPHSVPLSASDGHVPASDGAATSAAAESDAGQEPQRCAVCLMDFDEGDRLRILPCFHRYHKECIDPWLVRDRRCPICKMYITAAPDFPQPTPP